MDPNDPRHGTTAGYYAHQAAYEYPCPPCRRARRDKSRARRAADKAAGRKHDELRGGQRGKVARPRREYLDGDVRVPLEGGQWRGRRGIMVWEPLREKSDTIQS